MNNKWLLIAVVVIALLAVVWFVFGQGSQPATETTTEEVMTEETTTEEAVEDEGTTEEEGVMEEETVEDEDTMTKEAN